MSDLPSQHASSDRTHTTPDVIYLTLTVTTLNSKIPPNSKNEKLCPGSVTATSSDRAQSYKSDSKTRGVLKARKPIAKHAKKKTHDKVKVRNETHGKQHTPKQDMRKLPWSDSASCCTHTSSSKKYGDVRSSARVGEHMFRALDMQPLIFYTCRTAARRILRRFKRR